MERGGTGVAATSKDNLLTQLGAASTSALTTGLAGKQNTLTFDSTPTQNSTNPVTSGGVYAANNAQNTQIANLKSNAGIVEDGNTATYTISKGRYVIWKGVLYTADAAIASGTTLAASGGNKNLTAVLNGGLNALNSKIDSMLSGVSFIAFQTASNISATLNLVNGFRGLLFCTSAYVSNAGIISISVTNSGVAGASVIIGASEITINSSVNNKITVSSTQWTRCFLMSTDGASIAS